MVQFFSMGPCPSISIKRDSCTVKLTGFKIPCSTTILPRRLVPDWPYSRPYYRGHGNGIAHLLIPRNNCHDEYRRTTNRLFCTVTHAFCSVCIVLKPSYCILSSRFCPLFSYPPSSLIR